jgi:hypothetical protein
VAILIVTFSLLVFLGYEAYPDAVGILLGIFCCCSIAYFLSAPTEGSDQKDKVRLGVWGSRVVLCMTVYASLVCKPVYASLCV